MTIDLSKKLKAEIISEIDFLKRDYESIKNFLKGVQYEKNQIRTFLHSFKEHLSKTKSLLISYFKIQSKNFNLEIQPIMDSIDLALILIESTSAQWDERTLLQLSLAISKIKIENIMSSISTIRTTEL